MPLDHPEDPGIERHAQKVDVCPPSIHWAHPRHRLGVDVTKLISPPPEFLESLIVRAPIGSGRDGL